MWIIGRNNYFPSATIQSMTLIWSLEVAKQHDVSSLRYANAVWILFSISQ